MLIFLATRHVLVPQVLFHVILDLIVSVILLEVIDTEHHCEEDCYATFNRLDFQLIL